MINTTSKPTGKTSGVGTIPTPIKTTNMLQKIFFLMFAVFDISIIFFILPHPNNRYISLLLII